jgi:hypothetical protein
MVKKLFKHWFQEPIIVPRWLLVLQYAFFMLLGVAIAVATHSTFSEVSPGSYTEVWAMGITASAAVAFIGSFHERWEAVERWAALTLCSLLIGYAIAPIELLLQGDSTRTAYSVLALMISLLPSTRVALLIKRTGLPHHE